MNAREITRRLAELIGEDELSPLDAFLPTVGDEDRARMWLDGGDGTRFVVTVEREDTLILEGRKQ